MPQAGFDPRTVRPGASRYSDLAIPAQEQDLDFPQETEADRLSVAEEGFFFKEFWRCVIRQWGYA